MRGERFCDDKWKHPSANEHRRDGRRPFAAVLCFRNAPVKNQSVFYVNELVFIPAATRFLNLTTPFCPGLPLVATLVIVQLHFVSLLPAFLLFISILVVVDECGAN